MRSDKGKSEGRGQTAEVKAVQDELKATTIGDTDGRGENLRASTTEDREGHRGKPESFNHSGHRGTRGKPKSSTMEDTEEPSGNEISDNCEH